MEIRQLKKTNFDLYLEEQLKDPDYLCFPDGVTLPGAALPGVRVLRSASMKMNWSGGTAHISCVLCAAWLTLFILISKSVPDPDSGVKSFE